MAAQRPRPAGRISGARSRSRLRRCPLDPTRPRRPAARGTSSRTRPTRPRPNLIQRAVHRVLGAAVSSTRPPRVAPGRAGRAAGPPRPAPGVVPSCCGGATRSGRPAASGGTAPSTGRRAPRAYRRRAADRRPPARLGRGAARRATARIVRTVERALLDRAPGTDGHEVAVERGPVFPDHAEDLPRRPRRAVRTPSPAPAGSSGRRPSTTDLARAEPNRAVPARRRAACAAGGPRRRAVGSAIASRARAAQPAPAVAAAAGASWACSAHSSRPRVSTASPGRLPRPRHRGPTGGRAVAQTLTRATGVEVDVRPVDRRRPTWRTGAGTTVVAGPTRHLGSPPRALATSWRPTGSPALTASEQPRQACRVGLDRSGVPGGAVHSTAPAPTDCRRSVDRGSARRRGDGSRGLPGVRPGADPPPTTATAPVASCPPRTRADGRCIGPGLQRRC